MPRFKHIVYIVLISSLLFSHTPVGNSQEAIPVTYRAEFKPFGGSYKWNQAIPPDGGALGLDFALVLSPGTLTAEVGGDILLNEDDGTVSVRGTGGYLSSDGGVILTGEIFLDFTLPLPFSEEDDAFHINYSVPIPRFPKIDKGWDKSVQFNSFLLSGNSVKLDIGIRELVTVQLSGVEIGAAIVAAVGSGGTAAVVAPTLADHLSDYLDAGLQFNGGLGSELTLAGKAVTVNGASITSEGQLIRAPDFDPAEETYQIQSGYDEECTYTLDLIASSDVYLHITVLGGIIWSYNIAEKRFSIIGEQIFDLDFRDVSTSEEIDVPPEPPEPPDTPSEPSEPPDTPTEPSEPSEPETPTVVPPRLPGTLTQVVSIPDEDLEEAVRNRLNIRRDESGHLIPITRKDMLRLTDLYVYQYYADSVKSLIGLEYAVNLRKLRLNNPSVSDWSPLAGLPNLRELWLFRIFPSKLSLSNLSSLTLLSLQNSPSPSEVFVSNLPKLKELILAKISLSKLSLSNLPEPWSLHFKDTTISEVSLSNLPNLRDLHLRGSALSELSVSNVPNLRVLDLSYNAISDVSLLAGITHLGDLDLSHNAISDVSLLAGITNLWSLDLSHNAISDWSPLAGLLRLGHLNLSHNAISDVSPLATRMAHSILDLSYNSISDVSPLAAGFTTLSILDLWDNPLNEASLGTHIPAMRTRGVHVVFRAHGFPRLVKISGEGQIGEPNATLPTPLVVQALGEEDKPLSGISIRFLLYIPHSQDYLDPHYGMLSTTTATTDATGKAQTTLTLGHPAGPARPRTIKVAAIADEFPAGVSFTAIVTLYPEQIPEDANGDSVPPEQIPGDPNGEPTPPEQIPGDANGDGGVDILDLTLVGSSFGQQGATAADVNGDGVVNIKDLVLVSGAISNAAAAPAAGSGGEQ